MDCQLSIFHHLCNIVKSLILLKVLGFLIILFRNLTLRSLCDVQCNQHTKSLRQVHQTKKESFLLFSLYQPSILAH